MLILNLTIQQIGDESGEGSKQIKVITSSKEEKEKPKGGKGRQGNLDAYVLSCSKVDVIVIHFYINTSLIP